MERRKDSALLHELESVLDRKTFKDIVEPLWPQRRPSESAAAATDEGAEAQNLGKRERRVMPEFQLDGSADDGSAVPMAQLPDKGPNGNKNSVRADIELVEGAVHSEAPIILDDIVRPEFEGISTSENAVSERKDSLENIDESPAGKLLGPLVVR